MSDNLHSATDFLFAVAEERQAPDADFLESLLASSSTNTEQLLEAAAIPRQKYYQNKVRIHVLNNVRNGHCAEDCGYCAQRKGRQVEIPSYPDKGEAEILEEAAQASKSGAYRYCMAASGTGLTKKSTSHYADLIRKIKSKYPLEVCLSAGLVSDEAMARELQAAGLDRYNHNLNSGERNYGNICTTHDYQDRLQTMQIMKKAGVSLCSGIIAGLGESDAELAEVALTLRSLEVPSIPINFFLPVPGHAIQNAVELDQDRCLRILALFRLANPSAEIRMAAGREHYLGNVQGQALRVSNSLFVAGYLNAQGSDTQSTLQMIQGAGFSIDTAHSDQPRELETMLSKSATVTQGSGKLQMKSEDQLRPFKVASQ